MDPNENYIGIFTLYGVTTTDSIVTDTTGNVCLPTTLSPTDRPTDSPTDYPTDYPIDYPTTALSPTTSQPTFKPMNPIVLIKHTDLTYNNIIIICVVVTFFGVSFIFSIILYLWLLRNKSD